MKTNLFVSSLCAALLSSIYISAAADNKSPPKHYYHNFVASNGKASVSNQNGVLTFSGVDPKGNAVTEVPVDSNGTCLKNAKGVFINSVKYIDATKSFVAAGYADIPPKLGSDEQPTQSWLCSSADGYKWNVAGIDSSTDPMREERFMDVDYSDGYYVAVGQRFDKALVKVLKAQLGDDLTKKPWLEIQTADGKNAGYAINSVVFGGDRFVAVANDSSIYTFVAPKSKINNSSDWLPYRVQNIPGSANFNQVIYAKDKNMFVLIGDNSTAFISTANADGLLWDMAQFPTRYGRYNHANLNQIIYANNMFVIAADSDTIFYSPDGVNWNTAEGISGSVNLNQITYSAPEFKAAGVDDSGKETTWFATNGMNWNKSTFPYLYVKDSAGYDLYGAATYANSDGKVRRSYKGASLGGHQTIGTKLQPVGGLKKGDRICISATTGDPTFTNFYFELEEDAVTLANTTIAWTEGTTINPSEESVTGLKLITTKYENNSHICGSIQTVSR